MKINRRNSSIAIILIFAMVFVQTFSSISSSVTYADDSSGSNISDTFEDGVLTISGTGAIPNSAYKGRTDITQVVIGEGITTVGNYAFQDCTSLENVDFPSTVTSLNYSAFSGCTQLQINELPDTVTKMEGGVFRNCSQITSLRLPAGLTTMGDDALAGTSLTEIFIPKTLKDTASAFEHVPTLETVEFEDGMTTIPRYVCENSSVKTVIWPEGVTTIGYRAFYGCTQLETYELPDTVTKMEGDAFRNCSQITSFRIPSGLTDMDDDALAGTSLTEIFIPKTLKDTSSAFDQVSTLEKIEFEEGMTRIPSYVCENSSVKTVILHEGLTTVGYRAFAGCTGLSSVDFPDSLKTIENDAFRDVTDFLAFCNYKSLGVKTLIENAMRIRDNGTVFVDNDDLVLDPVASSYRIDTESTSINGCVPFTVNYKIKDTWKTNVSNIGINIFIPWNTDLSESTLMLDGVLCQNFDYNESTHVLWVPVTKTTGTISFGAMVNESKTLYSYASVSLRKSGQNYEEIIGTVGEDFVGITISCDSRTSNTTVTAKGVAPKSTEVSIYVNDEFVETVTSKKTGSWSADIDLPDPGSFSIYKIRATVTIDGEEASADTMVTYRTGAPAVTSFEMEYKEHDITRKVDILNSKDVKPVVYFLPGTEFVFKVGIKNNEKVDAVYVNSTRNNITKQLKAEYDEESGLYVTSGFFDPKDKNYVPGNLAVTYDQKSEGLTREQMQSQVIDKLAEAAIDDGAVVSNKTVTTEADGSELIKADVDMSALFNDESYENIETEIRTFDENTDYNVSEIFNMYGFDEDDVKVIHTVDGDDLTIGYDFSDPKNVLMVVSTAVGFAEKITDAVYAVKMKHPTGPFTKAHAEAWSAGYSIVSFALDAQGAYYDHKDLVNQINTSNTITNKAKALREADELAHDQYCFLALATVMGIMISGTGLAAAAPALALIGCIKLLSDVFWQGRTNHALTGEYKIRMVIDPSGYIYDMTSQERVPDATVTAYWIPDDGSEDFWDNKPADTEYGTIWDASEYEQENPMMTNSDGKYAWDVPQGWWRVKTEKEGYGTAWSDWVPVPPIQTEVNIGILSNVIPDQYEATAYINTKAFAYSGKAADPGVVVFDKLTSKALVKDTDYELSYNTNRTDIGVHSVTVTYLGKYGSNSPQTFSFTISPNKAVISKAKAAKKKCTVTLKTHGGGVSYQVQYRLGKGKWKTKNTAKTKLTIKKLKSKKKYQIRVRVFKTVGGTTYYGAWSAVKKVKIK